MNLKDDVIALQKSRLADQLLETTTPVQETLKSEMNSYRDTLLHEMCSPVRIPSPVLANAVRNGFREGERSKNVMIFGVSENDSVEAVESISTIFTFVQQKPHVQECLRIGKKGRGRYSSTNKSNLAWN